MALLASTGLRARIPLDRVKDDVAKAVRAGGLWGASMMYVVRDAEWFRLPDGECLRRVRAIRLLLDVT